MTGPTRPAPSPRRRGAKRGHWPPGVGRGPGRQPGPICPGNNPTVVHAQRVSKCCALSGRGQLLACDQYPGRQPEQWAVCPTSGSPYQGRSWRRCLCPAGDPRPVRLGGTGVQEQIRRWLSMRRRKPTGNSQSAHRKVFERFYRHPWRRSRPWTDAGGSAHAAALTPLRSAPHSGNPG